MRVWQKHWSVMLLITMVFLFLGTSAALADNGQVSGIAWLEKSVDGVIGSGEGGLSGVKITLEKQDENGSAQVAVNTTTAKSGDFLFSSLSAGQYRLRVEAEKSYRFTFHGLDSAALPAQGNVSYTPWFSLGDGDRLTLNVGFTKLNSSVSLIAFEDENANGGRMQSEPLVRGVQAEVIYDYEGETYVLAAALTDRDGQALIRELSPGTYRVRVTVPEHLAIGPLGQKINGFYNCILPGEGVTGVSDYFTLNAKEGVTMGIGMVRTGSLNGSIWFDANYNGLWDGEEGGLTGAVISLYSPLLGVSRSTQANEKGAYTFQSLQPGDYQLDFALPEGMIFTYPGVSLITDTSDHASMTVNIQVDVTTDLGAVGAMPAAGFSLTLYRDENQNGVQDENEQALPGAQVAAIQGGKKVETAVTDENGVALFHALRGGETTLNASLPEGWLFDAADGGLFSVTGAQTQAEASIFLDGQEPGAQYAAAVLPGASISGMLFEDADNSGLYRDGYALLSGYTVEAVDLSGAAAAQAVTDETGAYTLSPLLPGTYTVRFLLDDAYVAAPYAADQNAPANHILSQTPEFGETEAVSLSAGQRMDGVDGGVFRAGLVEGYVYIDEAYASEAVGMSGVSVVLVGEDGNPFSDFTYGTSDETGYYFIKGVQPGTYSLLYSMPENGVFTQPENGGKHWISPAFSVESGSVISMDGLRGIFTASLSGVIEHADMTDSVFSALMTLRGHEVNQVVQIHTQPDGSFAFANLQPGGYTLTVTLPDGLIFGQKEGSLFPASFETQASVDLTLDMGEDRRDVNLLAAAPVSLFGVMYYDDNLSGFQDEEEYGAEGRLMALYASGEEAASIETAESGSFYMGPLLPGQYELHISLDENEELLQFSNAQREDSEWVLPLNLMQDTPLVLPVMRYASVSGQVWSLDGSLNGVSGIPVSLLDSEGEAILECETDGEGAFSFSGLTPGSYSLSAQLPQGYLFARAQDAKERESFILSQADGSVGSIVFDVPMGDDLSGMDIGIGTMGRIGDRAWLDENGNGLQDTGEPGMPGIIIEMYQNGQRIASATTDEYGRYSMEDLFPGEYEMRVTMHKELKATVHVAEFPLVNSLMPDSDETTVTVEGVIVPSGGANLHCDLGFVLRKKGEYPAAMDLIPAKDWRPYSER